MELIQRFSGKILLADLDKYFAHLEPCKSIFISKTYFDLYLSPNTATLFFFFSYLVCIFMSSCFDANPQEVQNSVLHWIHIHDVTVCSKSWNQCKNVKKTRQLGVISKTLLSTCHVYEWYMHIYTYIHMYAYVCICTYIWVYIRTCIKPFSFFLSKVPLSYSVACCLQITSTTSLQVSR